MTAASVAEGTPVTFNLISTATGTNDLFRAPMASTRRGVCGDDGGRGHGGL